MRYKSANHNIDLTDAASRQLGGEIIGNEARQNSKLRETSGLDYFNAVNFDTPLTASQAYSLAEPYFKCPSSNAPINFKLIPAINATFAGPAPHKAGDVINVAWGMSFSFLNDIDRHNADCHNRLV